MPTFTRELGAAEREKLQAHLLALGSEDRRLRFGHARSDESIGQYVDGIDFARDAVFVVTDADLAVVGAAHLARGAGNAELGVSVLESARGRGVGAALLERSATRARNWGVRVLFMNCLAESEAMLHLARKQGLHVAISSGEAEAFVKLPQPSLSSVAAEVYAEQIGLLDHAQKSQWEAWRKLWIATSQATRE
jgi:GNAT superfamily N-acetyltransferase